MDIPWCFRADIPTSALSRAPFVINLDDKGGRGTHWTAAMVRDGRLYYADPFGTVLNGHPPAEFDRYTDRVVNTVAFQHPSTSLCGYYSVCFVRAMRRIKTKIDLSTFERLLTESITTP